MFIPKWLLVLIGLLFTGLAIWTYLLVSDRNPLPFPDRGSRIFSASSPEAKDAIVTLLSQHDLNERVQANSSGILRSIMWDGTIINHSPPDMRKKLGGAVASIGIVANDPVESANSAANFLRSRGFEAEVVLDVEPELPIAFVTTNAMLGTVLNFRKHLIHFPAPGSTRE
ncbi:MAG: hypothetical protein H0V76_03925 [Blastocatellia bacterium]|nr:hypothetical protein [Blastocatellia bacterium]